MAPHNKAVTLRDLHLKNYAVEAGMPSTADNADILASNDAVAAERYDGGLHAVYHIPALPQAVQARAMLERVVHEFRPIAKRRGYVVLSVSELCCCNDGLDFRNVASGQAKPRKLRKVSNNIWGYNRTMSRNGPKNKKVHTIHIRLRHPQNHHRFLPYEDVAGTLAHELSHCEHGPHNDKFYNLMDSILEEHASLMASNFSLPGQFQSSVGTNASITGVNDFTPFAGPGHTLGGTNQGQDGKSKDTHTMGGQGRALGGDVNFTQWMSPREAAVAAALARQRQQQLRLRGNRCCRPCLVTIREDGGVEDEVQVINVVPAPIDRKRPPVTGYDDMGENHMPTKRNLLLVGSDIIDLTADEDSKPASVVRWACRSCTFLNAPTTESACEICLAPKA